MCQGHLNERQIKASVNLVLNYLLPRDLAASFLNCFLSKECFFKSCQNTPYSKCPLSGPQALSSRTGEDGAREDGFGMEGV